MNRGVGTCSWPTDRATRWVHVEIKTTKSAQAARASLTAARARPPFRIRQLLTDNDKASTDRLQSKRRTRNAGHVFDKLCAAAGIEHRLIPVRRAKTNCMVERFNGRIRDVLASHRFNTRKALETTLKHY